MSNWPSTVAILLLLYMTFFSQPQALIEFLERGHNPDGMNMDGQCPLHTYIVRQSKKKKYLDFLYTMLTHSRANVDVPTFDQISPLHMAIKARQLII